MNSVAGRVSTLVASGVTEVARTSPKLWSPGSGAIDAELRVVEELSNELHLPVNEVREIYRQQLQRLAAGARIQGFLGVLAMRNTRSVLRGGHREKRLG